MPERPPTIPERIGAAAGEPPSADIPVAPDSWRSPEDGAEQLYALWRDYNRRKVGVYRKEIARYWEEHKVSPPPLEGEREGVAPEDGAPPPPTPPPGGRGRDVPRIPESDRAALMAAVDTDPSLAPLREAIRVRFHEPNIRQAFERNLERILASEAHIQPTRAAYEEERQRHDTARSRELDIYRTIFSHRDREPDELSLLELADLHARATATERTMRTAEQANPELAAQLSFERIRTYGEQLRGKSHFCMTPSREHAIADLMRDAVILNRNRPLVVVGETGTGKTEVIRALARLLTGKEPARTTARDQGDPDRTLGFRAIETEGGQQRTTTAYGVIGQALTGKRTALDEKPGPGTISFLDEGNKYPESFIRMLVKTLAGREPGERVTFDAWYGEQEPLAPQSLLVLGMNLPDPERGRHLDRPDFSPELKREFAPTTHRLEYIPQTPEDPEVYEILLGACVDKNERVRIPKEDLAPSWNPIPDVVTNTKRDVLDTAPASGGALWRLAMLIAATQKRYTEARTAGQPALEQAVLDVGVAVAWIQEHQKTNIRGRGERVTFQQFLAEKLAAWAGIAGTPSGQTLFRKEDREALAQLFREFRLDAASTAETQQPYPVGKRDSVHPLTVLSPSEIGACSPRVPRVPEFLGDTPDATTANATLEDSTIVKYRPLPLGDVRPGVRFSPHGEDVSPPARGGATRPAKPKGRSGRGGGSAGVGNVWTFKGLTVGDERTPVGHAVLEGPDGIAQIVAPDALTTDFERERSELTATVRADAITSIPAERGKEVTLDLQEVLDSSLAFLEAKAPPAWAQSLREEFPHGITLTPEQRTTIERAMEHGFTRVLLMPSADAQGITTVDKHDPADPTKTIPTLISPDTLRATTDHLLTTCVTDPVPGLPVEDQYIAPYVHESEKTKVPTLRKGAPARTRPYFVFVGPGSIPENLKNLTYPDAERAFANLARDLNIPTLTGATTLERLLHQRREIEARAPLTPAQRTATYGDARLHAFDAYSNTDTESNWTWDLDSRVPGGCVRGGWFPGNRQSGVHWVGAAGRDPGLGARPAVVVEL